jgi:hypothetical protein
MIEAWRYTCARCGSVCVLSNAWAEGWNCRACGVHTPAVYDLKQNRWDHIAQTEQPSDPVPSSGRSL